MMVVVVVVVAVIPLIAKFAPLCRRKRAMSMWPYLWREG
jgi:hypothetical protein